ncbi:MAG: hypothetical protein PUB49_10355 [Selenomonadaceae bacterium]|nr:hypothetical protein [Selenomonadaceae bacterium]
MFDKQMTFSGKHADYLRHLAPSKKMGESKMQRTTIFSSNIEVLKVAPVVGFLFNRLGQVERDKEITDNTVFLEQVLKIQKNLMQNYRLIMLLHDQDKVSVDERINRAFRYDRQPDKRAYGDKVFNQYLLGGIEVLYEELIEGKDSLDEDVRGVAEFLLTCKEMFGSKFSMERIDALCNETKI